MNDAKTVYQTALETIAYPTNHPNDLGPNFTFEAWATSVAAAALTKAGKMMTPKGGWKV
jgi:hypothetical protein